MKTKKSFACNALLVLGIFVMLHAAYVHAVGSEPPPSPPPPSPSPSPSPEPSPPPPAPSPAPTPAPTPSPSPQGAVTPPSPTPATPAGDTTAPVISQVKVTKLTATSATITWQTNELATSAVAFGKTNAYGKTQEMPSYVTDHSVQLARLTSVTTYHFKVESADAAGNKATSENQIFSTAADSPKTSQQAQTGTKKPLPWFLIAIGAFLAIVLAFLLFWWLRRRKRSDTKKKTKPKTSRK